MKSILVLLALLSVAGTTTWKAPSGIRAIIGNHDGDNAGYLMALGDDFYLMFAYEYASAPLCLADDLSPPFDHRIHYLIPDQPTTWGWHLSGSHAGDLIIWECLAR